MVWFWKNRHTIITDRLENIAGKVSGIAGLVGSIQEKAEEIHASIEKAHAKIDTALTKISRHDDALMDVMESFEDLSDQEAEKLDKLEKMIAHSNDSRIRELEKKQADLLNVIMAYHAQLGYLQSLLAKNPAWSEQISLAMDKLASLTESIGLQAIADTGKRVNYSFHEVIEAVETNDPAKDKTVERVFEPGMQYCGTVVKKAKIAAYKYERKETNEHNSWN